MEDNSSNLLVETSPPEDLDTRLLQETDIDEIRGIIDLFNLNIKKKDIIRVNKLSELQDKIYEQLDKRMTANADTFSNKDLLDYFKVIQDTINKTDINSAGVVEPQWQINQNTLNISALNVGPTLSRDSRQNILNAVGKILQMAENPIQSTEEGDVEFDVYD